MSNYTGAVPDTEPARNWLKDAACRADDIDPEWFFPAQENGPSLSKARAVCAGCWVQNECLTYALTVEGGKPAKTRDGVWAGTTGNERYRLYQRSLRRAKAAA